MQLVPINNGYSYIKSELGLTFKSAYRETTLSEYGCNCDILVLDGKVYAIGDGIPSIEKDKTSNIATKLFVLNMLCKRMNYKNSEHFKVYLTAPPMTFASQKESIPKYLIGSYKVTYNGAPKEIFIDDVSVYPETIMAYLANYPKPNNRPVIVIDVGGLTTNVAYINNGVYSKDTIISFTNGMYHVENAVCDYLNDKYWELDLDDSAIMHQLLERGLRIGDSDKNIMDIERDGINNIFDKFVIKIVNKIALKKWSPTTCDILITGGGGKTLYNCIKNHYPHAVLSSDPIFDNLKGMKGLIARDSVKKEHVVVGVR